MEMENSAGCSGGKSVEDGKLTDTMRMTNETEQVDIVTMDKLHQHFERDGSDIHYTARISLRDALCGTTLQIPSLDGTVLSLICTNEIVQPNYTKRIPGQGLPLPEQPSRRGDLIVQFDIQLGNETEFSQLMTILTSVDLRVLLEKEVKKEETSNRNWSDVDPHYVLRCCHLLETTLQYIAQRSDCDNADQSFMESQLLQINKTLLELVNFLLEFFGLMHEEKRMPPNIISLPLYRFVCAYLAEGLALVQKENLIGAAKPLLQFSQACEDTQQFDSMDLLLPALSELVDLDSEWDSVRNAFLSNGVIGQMKTRVEKGKENWEVYQELTEQWIRFDKK